MISAHARAREPEPAVTIEPEIFSLLTGDELPSGVIAPIHAWKGRVERKLYDALQEKDRLAMFEGFNHVLLGCMDSLNGQPVTRPAVLDMLDCDRRGALLRVRRRTFRQKGGLVEWKWKCAPPYVAKGSGCGKSNESEVDMDGLTFTRPPAKVEAVKLPVSGKMLTYDLQTGHTALAYIKLRKENEKVDPLDMMVARGVRLDGAVVNGVALEDLEGDDLAVIKREINREYGPDSKVEAECKYCGASMSAPLEVLPGFFFPGEAR